MRTIVRAAVMGVPIVCVIVAVAIGQAAHRSRARTTGGAKHMTTKATAPKGREIATLAGGCFWCVEAIFEELRGVEEVRSGYAGGSVVRPTYQQVCTGATGHAEAVRIVFDPGVISYADILRIFLASHDPTTLNRQGADIGTQYRSAIFTHSDAQAATAREIINEVTQAKLYADPIVTEVTPFTSFYEAEGYHEDYFARNPEQAYCRAVIAPKVAKFREKYRARLKAQP